MKLASTTLSPSAGEARRWVVFLHGILGSRSNWRSIARAWLRERPGYGAILVDLRMHGDSQGAAPPHTVESAARDLESLEVPGPIAALVGHSFGGKVALERARTAPDGLEEVWIVDSSPGARPSARGSERTVAVVSTLESLPRRWASREAFVDRVVAEGYEQALGHWLAMNLAREGDEYALRLDLQAIRALLDDYFARDLWPVVEHPPGATHVHVVIGDRSAVLDDEDRARVYAAAERSARVHVHVLPAGHWVHVDAPDALAALFSTREP